MKASALIFAAVVALAAAIRAERVDVDIAALAACADGTTNGWAVCGIDSYADGRTNVRLSEQLDYIDSPVFPRRIMSLESRVKSSNESGRRLAFIALDDGILSDDETRRTVCGYSPTKDTYVQQTNFFDYAANVRAFRISYDDPRDGRTGWGLSELTVVMADAAAPENVTASRIRSTGFSLSWSSDANTVSNRVTVSEQTSVPESGTVEREYGFEAFSNGGDTGEKTDMILAAIPDFEGSSMLCLPTNSTGQIQISNGSTKGVLVVPGPQSCEGAALRLTARHYNSQNEEKTMSVGFIQSDGTTNDFATVNLTTEFTTTTIPLDDVPDGSIIVLNNAGNKRNHRVILDEASFLGGYVAAHVETSVVATVDVEGTATAAIRGLERSRTYCATVTAFGGDGIESDPSEPLPVTTAASDPGLTISVR